MSKAPTIGGIKMKKLGKGKPGRMKNLVKRHLGDKAAEKITKSDGAALVAKGKKTGNTDLVRKGSFIRNMMRGEAYDAGHDYADHTTRVTPGQKNYDPNYQGKKYKPAKPGSGKRVVEMEEDKQPDLSKTRQLARAGLVSKKDLSKFEVIMRKMERNQGDTAKLTTQERNFLASIYDDLLARVIKDPSIFSRMRRSVKEEVNEKKLTPAEKKKREEVAQAIERDNPGMPMAKKMAIATATAKRVAEDSHADGSYSKKKLKMAAEAATELDGMLGDSDDLPEWVQGKITKAADYLDSARDYMKNKGDDGKGPVGESAQAWKKWAKTPAGKRYAALSTKEKEAKAKRNRMNEETEIGGKSFDDLELCALAVKAFKKDYQEADDKQKVLAAAQAVDNYLAIERKGLEGKIGPADLTKMKQLVTVAKKKIADAGLSASDHDYHQGHIDTVEKLVKKHINEDIERTADVKMVKVKLPDGRVVMRKQKKEIKVGDTGDVAKTESMYKSPAHARLQKHMDRIRKTKSYQNQVRKLGGTPLKPGEQNPMKRTTEETVMEPVKPQEGKAKDMTAVRDLRQGKKQYKQDNEKNQKQNVKDTIKRVTMKEDMCCDDCNDHFDHVIEEATYQGKSVKLNDPIRTNEVPTKKFKVYVKDPATGNIKVVRFGDPGLSIKRDDPARRKSFRARHNCDNPGPKTKARYWSCYQWRSGAKVDN